MIRTPPTRRTVLGSVAGILTAVAGCTETTDSNTRDAQSTAIDEVSASNSSIEITLLEEADVDTVSLISPSGTAFETKSVVTGATRVILEVGVEYQTGTYQIIASSDGDEVDRSKIHLQPEIQIRDVIVGGNTDRSVPKNLPFVDEQALIIVENTGTGADSAKDLSIDGGVPNPTEPGKKRDSGIYDNEDGYGAAEKVIVPAGTRTFLWSTTKPFLFTGDGIECESSKQEHRATVNIEFGISGRTSQNIEVQYSAEETSGDCTLAVIEE